MSNILNIVTKSLTNDSTESDIQAEIAKGGIQGRIVSVAKRITEDMIGAAAAELMSAVGPLIYKDRNCFTVLNCSITRTIKVPMADGNIQYRFSIVYAPNFRYYINTDNHNNNWHLHITDTSADGNEEHALKVNDLLVFTLMLFPNTQIAKNYLVNLMPQNIV